MKWSVEIDFCGTGSIIGKERAELYFPKMRVETDRMLTEYEKERINDEVVKAVKKVMTEIEGEVAK